MYIYTLYSDGGEIAVSSDGKSIGFVVYVEGDDSDHDLSGTRS